MTLIIVCIVCVCVEPMMAGQTVVVEETWYYCEGQVVIGIDMWWQLLETLKYPMT